MAALLFQVGDLVTRDGSDVQRVTEVGEYGDVTVVCVKAPASGWCKVGDTELNLVRRYQHAGPVIDGSADRTENECPPLFPLA